MPATKLLYAINTNPVPLQASDSDPTVANLIATLSLNATNDSSADVTLQAISVSIPLGTDALSLTNDSVAIGPVAPFGWMLAQTQNPSGSVIYIFTPDSNHPHPHAVVSQN